MKTTLFAAIVLALPSLTAAAAAADSIHCHFEGVIEGRPMTKKAQVYEMLTDPRYDCIMSVPVTDGKFSFDITAAQPGPYEIIFDDELNVGAWTNKRFFVEDGTVRGYYYSEELSDSNRVVSDGPAEAEKQRFKTLSDKLFGERKKAIEAEKKRLEESGEAFLPEVRPFYFAMKAAADNAARDSISAVYRPILDSLEWNIDSEAAISLNEEMRRIYVEEDSVRRAFIAETPSVFGLSEILLTAYVSSRPGGPRDAADTERIFRERYGDFASHPLYTRIVNTFAGNRIKPDMPYINFPLRDADGTTTEVQSLIKGRPAIIDLWASWCSPCRRTSKSLIPLYNEYAPKGLAYVAVAREFGNADEMHKAIEKDGYPWKSYVEIDDRDNIWTLNGCPNAGGRVILVGADGLIDHVNPDTRTVEAWLKEVLP